MKRGFSNRLLLSTLVCCLSGIVFPLKASAVTLNLDSNGYLIGASEVDVKGVLYDVAFVQGSCFEVFGDCDDPFSDFMFTSVEDGNAASGALLAQVFVDGPLGNFDTDLDLMGFSGTEATIIFTPNSLNPLFPGAGPDFTSVGGSSAHNLSEEADDRVSSSFLLTSSVFDSTRFDETLGGAYFWADWTLSQPAPVPVPAAFWLFGTALIGLVGFCKRQKAA